MKYRAEIDGLRAIAVLPVILFHAGIEWFSGGFIGVDVFFVISGYLITDIILSELRESRFTLGFFYERRARRILPTLFTVLLASLPLSLMYLEPSDLEDYSKSLIAVSLFGSNFLFWLESSYWGVASDLKPLIHTWSLAVEEQFYLLFPLLLMFLWRLSKKLNLVILCILFLSSLVWSQYLSVQAPDTSFFLLPTRMWELLIGALIALVLSDKVRQSWPFKNTWFSSFFALLGLLLIFWSIVKFNEATIHPGINTLVPTLGTALVIVFASPMNIAGRILSMKLLVQLGLISYGAYLWHQLFFVISRHKNLTEDSTAHSLLLSVFSIFCAYLTFRFVEKPFRNRSYLSREKVFKYSVIGTLSFVFIGLFGLFTARDISLISSEAYYDRKWLVRQLIDERENAITFEHCHHMITGTLDVYEYMDKWACMGSEESKNKRPRVGLYGDSHAADKGVMLSSNGANYLQVSGSECPLYGTSPKRCHEILEFFHKKANEFQVKTVLLSNRFNKNELKPHYLQQLVDDWSQRYENVYLFSPMIEFPYWRKNFLVKARLRYEIDDSAYEEFYQAMEEVIIPANVKIIDIKALLCNLKSDCNKENFSHGYLLMDSNHLSVSGSQIFGQRLSEYLENEFSKQKD